MHDDDIIDEVIYDVYIFHFLKQQDKFIDK